MNGERIVETIRSGELRGWGDAVECLTVANAVHAAGVLLGRVRHFFGYNVVFLGEDGIIYILCVEPIVVHCDEHGNPADRQPPSRRRPHAERGRRRNHLAAPG